MSGLVLEINTSNWRAHLDEFAASCPDLVPVAKGNGYGFGIPRLVAEAIRMDLPTLTVGIAEEVAVARDAGWERDILVLMPWQPDDELATELAADEHIITTVSRLRDIKELLVRVKQPRILLEVKTSMMRFGLMPDELKEAATLAGAQLEGWTIHLPNHDKVFAEAKKLAQLAIQVVAKPLWVSHLSCDQASQLASEFGVRVRLRVGTKLWLRGKDTYRVLAKVADLHPVKRGDVVGYHANSIHRNGWIVVVAAGTSHGLGLEAPASPRQFRQRVRLIGRLAGEMMGNYRSPFKINGTKAKFAEPPHMHTSLLFVPGNEPGVRAGDLIELPVRMPVSYFDRVIEN